MGAFRALAACSDTPNTHDDYCFADVPFVRAQDRPFDRAQDRQPRAGGDAGRRPRNVVDLRGVLSRRGALRQGSGQALRQGSLRLRSGQAGQAAARRGGPAPQFLRASGRQLLNAQETARQEAWGQATGIPAPGMAPARALSYPSDQKSHDAPEAQLQEVSSCLNIVASGHSTTDAAGEYAGVGK